MTNDLENFSKDQISAYDAVTETLKFAGVDLTQALLSPKATKNSFVLGVIGRAGTGKTLLISKLFHALELAINDHVVPGHVFEGLDRVGFLAFLR